MFVQEKSKDISRFDSIPTGELQEILRKHAAGELAAEPDMQVLFQIMGELQKRRQHQDRQAFRPNDEAYADSCKNYKPK